MDGSSQLGRAWRRASRRGEKGWADVANGLEGGGRGGRRLRGGWGCVGNVALELELELEGVSQHLPIWCEATNLGVFSRISGTRKGYKPAANPRTISPPSVRGTLLK